MIIDVTFKDHDTLSDSIRAAVAADVNRACGDVISSGERETLIESRLEAVYHKLCEWVEFGEYIRVRFDTESNGAIVLKP